MACQPLLQGSHSSEGTDYEMYILKNQCCSVSNWALKQLDTFPLNFSVSQSIFKMDSMPLHFSREQKYIH